MLLLILSLPEAGSDPSIIYFTWNLPSLLLRSRCCRLRGACVLALYICMCVHFVMEVYSADEEDCNHSHVADLSYDPWQLLQLEPCRVFIQICTQNTGMTQNNV
ncbi:hypothetical protein GDO78_001164 [Eleutherodactylus coqui]|uniref:Uncharacterized protein n=1 Tax=Eleutherodactylus coqui TaxID=57060 RepID=A0A8J6FSQ8_ELECQ|nr:hypothetical protein GDO78_001164 [Eleutherodactylus coqui]